MTQTARKVQIPGDTSEATDTATGTVDAGEAGTSEAAPAAAVPKAKAKSKAATAQAEAAPAAAGELPDESEIDPYSISRAVLTRQGWVCPAESPDARRASRE